MVTFEYPVTTMAHKKIRKDLVEEMYSLTSTQQGMLSASIRGSTSSIYNEQVCISLKGSIDLNMFYKALGFLIEQNTALRTVFRWEGLKDPIQIVLKEILCAFDYVDLERAVISRIASPPQNDVSGNGFQRISDLTGIRAHGGIVNRALNSKFDFDKPPWKLILIKNKTADYDLILTHHHILYDGWSNAILFKEFFRFYREMLVGKTPTMRNKVKFSRFVSQVSDKCQVNVLDERKKYWARYLNNFEPGNNSICIIPNSIRKSVRKKNTVYSTYDNKNLEELCIKMKLTQADVLYAAWGLLLQKLCNSRDIIFETTLSGRQVEMSGIEDVVGLFITTNPIRITTENKTSLVDVVNRVHSDLNESTNYIHTPLAELRRYYTDNDNRPDLSLMVIENYPLDIDSITEGTQLSINSIKNDNATEYDLVLEVRFSGCIELELSYQSDFYEEQAAVLILSYFKNVLQKIIESPQLTVSQLILPYDLNSVTVQDGDDFSEDSVNDQSFSRCHSNETIVDMVAGSVNRFPHKIALSNKTSKLTYLEFDQYSSIVADFLKNIIDDSSSSIGIVADRSISSVVAIMAILKAGLSYVPLNPELPPKTVEQIAERSNINTAFYSKGQSINETWKGLPINWVTVEEVRKNITDLNQPRKDLTIPSPESLAYIIYTSGTTGEPKGVRITHNSVVNVIRSLTELYSIESKEKILLFSSISFDASVEQMFLALTNGSELIVAQHAELIDQQKFVKLICKSKISHIHAVPDFIQSFNPDLFVNSRLKRIISGGDVCSAEIAKKWLKIGCKFYNEYGPTETTITSTVYEVEGNESNDRYLPMGRSIANVKTFVLDRWLNQLAPGHIGELYIGGKGVSPGYVGEKQKNKESFIHVKGLNEYKLYKTGDLVCIDESGLLHFRGRVDRQVKLRGHRIELEAIEAVLYSNSKVNKASVLLDPDSDCLVAYVSACDDNILTEREIYKTLKKKFPDYHVPRDIVFSDSLPVNQNGKIDKKLLLESHLMSKTKANTSIDKASLTDEEAILVQLYSGVLGNSDISKHDDFFRLGGDSIKALQISSRIQQYGYSLDINALYEQPVISDLALELSPLVREKAVELNPLEGSQFTPIQRWFFEQEISEAHHWNQSVLIRYEGKLNPSLVEKCFSRLIERHDMLKAHVSTDAKCFDYSEGLSFSLEVETGLNAHEVNQHASGLQATISLHKGPLLKACSYVSTEESHLFIACHHLIIDGVSWRILFDEFVKMYSTFEMGKEATFEIKPLTFQYWSKRIYEYARSLNNEHELSYWREVCAEQDILEFVNNSVRSHRTELRNASFSLSSQNTEELIKECNQAYNTDIQDLLLAGLSMGLSLLTKCKHKALVINLEGHGRERIDSELDPSGTVGWFTCQFPVKLNIEDKPLSSTVTSVKEQLRSIPNKGIGHGLLYYGNNNLTKAEKDSISYKPQISFNYLGQFDKDFKKDKFTLEIFRANAVSDKSEVIFPININGLVIDGVLTFDFEYSPMQVSPVFVSNLTETFRVSLLKLIKHCRNKENIKSTPSDFQHKSLDQSTIDNLIARF